MVEVRFQRQADCAVWNDSARAKALVGPALADKVSMCLQQIGALDSPEDIVRLPFTIVRDDVDVHVGIDGEVTITGRLEGHGPNRHSFVVDSVVMA